VEGESIKGNPFIDRISTRKMRRGRGALKKRTPSRAPTGPQLLFR